MFLCYVYKKRGAHTMLNIFSRDISFLATWFTWTSQATKKCVLQVQEKFGLNIWPVFLCSGHLANFAQEKF